MSDGEKRMDGPELVPDLKLAEFELQLARAMRRVDAPEGFAARVMECAANSERADAAPAPGDAAPRVVVMRPRFGSLRVRTWAGGAIAAMLALGMFGAEQLHQQHERAQQAALANQQFEAAVRVTDQALAQTREQLQRAGLNLGE